MNMLQETRHAARLNSRDVHYHLQLVNIESIMDLHYNLNISSEATCYGDRVSLVMYSFIEPSMVISMYGAMIGIREVPFS